MTDEFTTSSPTDTQQYARYISYLEVIDSANSFANNLLTNKLSNVDYTTYTSFAALQYSLEL